MSLLCCDSLESVDVEKKEIKTKDSPRAPTLRELMSHTGGFE